VAAEAPTIEEVPAAEPAPEEAPKAAKEDKKAAKKADKKGEKKGKDVPAAPDGAPTIAAHPRAVRSIARAKSWGGLLGFVIAGYLSLPTSTLAAAGLRALIAGVVGYVAVWGASVFVWRRLVMLEIKAREQELAALVKQVTAARAGPGAGARDAS
jgi:hypothetical protein